MVQTQIRKSRGEFVETRNYDAKRMAKIIAALGSGRYSKDDLYLRSGERFSLQGVICDVMDSSGWKDIEGVDWQTYKGYKFSMPLLAADALGINSAERRLLVSLSQSHHTFLEMAKILIGRFPECKQFVKFRYDPGRKATVPVYTG